MTAPPERRRARREAARGLLALHDAEALDRWISAEPQAWAVLQSLLFDPDPLVGWRAVEATGRLAALRAREGDATVREMVRRALWLMNDESGGVLWLGPQLMGAVLAYVPALCGEFLEVLAAFLEEEPFRSGTRWGLWRVALARPGQVAAAAGAALAASLSDADPDVRGHAALALAAAAGPAAAAAAAGDPAVFALFDPRTGTLRSISVGEAAAGAV